ncbi:MAG: hypothetical protein ACPG2Y_03550, partial [Acholeplasmataceae bacterium]
RPAAELLLPERHGAKPTRHGRLERSLLFACPDADITPRCLICSFTKDNMLYPPGASPICHASLTT